MENSKLEFEFVADIKGILSRSETELEAVYNQSIASVGTISMEIALGNGLLCYGLYNLLLQNKDKICNDENKKIFEYYLSNVKKEQNLYLQKFLSDLLIYDYKIRHEDWIKNKTLWFKDDFINEELKQITHTLNFKSEINEMDRFLKSAIVAYTTWSLQNIDDKKVIEQLMNYKSIQQSHPNSQIKEQIERYLQKALPTDFKLLSIEETDFLISSYKEKGVKYYIDICNKELELSEEKIIANEITLKNIIKYLQNGRSSYISPDDDLYVVFVKALKEYKIFLEKEQEHDENKENILQANKIVENDPMREIFVSILTDLTQVRLITEKQLVGFLQLYDNGRTVPKIDWNHEVDWLLYMLMNGFLEAKFIVLVEKESLLDLIYNNFLDKGNVVDKKKLSTTYSNAKKIDEKTIYFKFKDMKKVLNAIFNKYGFQLSEFESNELK